VSTLISALVSTVAAYSLARVVFSVFTVEFFAAVPLAQDALFALAAVSVVVGSALAVSQRDVRRMLAYSSVSQFGLVVAGFAVASSTAVVGAIIHLVGHAVMKGGLFATAGIIERKTGARTIEEYAGLTDRAPVAAAAFAVLAFSMVGVPPAVGFVGKWYIVLGAIEVGRVAARRRPADEYSAHTRVLRSPRGVDVLHGRADRLWKRRPSPNPRRLARPSPTAVRPPSRRDGRGGRDCGRARGGARPRVPRRSTDARKLASISDMTDLTSLRPLLAVLASVVAIPLIYAARGRPNRREAVTVAAAVTKFAVVASMVPGVLSGDRYEFHLGTFATGIDLVLRVDPLGLLFGLLASLLWIVTSFYSIGYMRGLDEHAQTRYFASFAASLAAAIGVAFAGNLLTLFVFYGLR